MDKEEVTVQEKAMPQEDGFASDEAYWSSLAEEMDKAAEIIPEEEMVEVYDASNNLHEEMRGFHDAEKVYGPASEVWQAYKPQQGQINENIQEMGKSYRDGASAGEKQQAMDKTIDSMNQSADFFKQQYERMLKREQTYQEELQEIRMQLLNMQKALQEFSPQEMAKCLAVGTAFIQAVEGTRREAHARNDLQMGTLYQESRNKVHETYEKIRHVSSEIKLAVKNKVVETRDKAIDAAVQKVAGIFDCGITYLEQKKQEFLNLSPIEVDKKKAADEGKSLNESTKHQQVATDIEPKKMTPKERLHQQRMEHGLEQAKGMAM